jgi:3-hydroxyisobutyrate dehydrogenase-like beta-hydroxyacid dehydrogenase
MHEQQPLESAISRKAVGFIGLGAMGKPMAARLLSQGYRVSSCAHRRRDAIEELKAIGLIEMSSPREVAAATDVVMTMVRNTQESEGVICGEQGVLAGMAQGAILILMSTLAPDFCRRVATQAASHGVAVLDAPVSGGPPGAVQGTLALMVGGARTALDHCRPLLESLGRVFACGDIGMGMVAKLANNAVAFGTMALVAEALSLARTQGMAEVQLLEVLQHSSANSFIVQHWELIRSMWAHIEPLGIKDVRTCLEVANAQAVTMPLTALTSHYPWPAAL